jgi:hypothetical protein
MTNWLLLLALSAGIPAQGSGQTDPVVVLAELPETGDPVVETALSADGTSAAFVTRGEDGDTLWQGGDRKANCEEIAQVTVAPLGLAYWCRNGDEQSIFFEEQSVGPFLDISLPNLDALAALAVPTAMEWGYRAGTRTVLAARDVRGEWQSYFRYSAAPAVQEKRGLPTTVTVSPGPDASVQKARSVRFRLTQGGVPLYLATEKREECVYLGSEALGCGQQVSMLAWASAAGRPAFAVTTSEGLMVYTGAQVWGPTRNLDWVAFSPDGAHLAFVMREGERQVLVVDDERLEERAVIESVVWTSDNRLVFLGHDEAGSHVFVGGNEVLARDLVTAVYVSPRGDVWASGRHQGRTFLARAGGADGVTGTAGAAPAAGAAGTVTAGVSDGFESLWGEGFLAGGELYGVMRLAGGRQAVLLGEKVSSPFDGVGRLSPSHDVRRLAGIGSTPDGDRLLVDLAEVGAPLGGRAEQLTWCGNERVLLRERRADADCASVGGEKPFCCARMVMSACGASGPPDFVCVEQGKYSLFLAGEKVLEPYDEIPPHLIWQDFAGGRFDFAARRGQEWFVVTDGKERPAGGKPLAVRPFQDSPWFLVMGKEGSRWMTRDGDGPWFSLASPPFEVGGEWVYRGRGKGQEWWVLAGRRLGPADEILSAPMPVRGGLAWWERAGGKRRLVWAPPEGASGLTGSGPAVPTGRTDR